MSFRIMQDTQNSLANPKMLCYILTGSSKERIANIHKKRSSRERIANTHKEKNGGRVLRSVQAVRGRKGD